MPCVAMTPAMPTPHDARCGAIIGSTSSATVRPLPPHHHCETPDSTTAAVSSSVYTRFWKYLFHYWTTSQPQPSKLEASSPLRRRRTMPTRLSASSEMRQRVEMLHELEAHPQHTQLRGSRNAMQTTCGNCCQRFFRAHGANANTDADVTTTQKKGDAQVEYCSLDCRSSAQYRATVQHSIDHAGAFEDASTWSSTPPTSR